MLAARTILYSVVLASLSARGLVAQAPAITPAGDPSVQADTLYRLAADAAQAGDDPVVYLLDDGVVRLDAAGRGTKTFRQIVHVRRQQVAPAFAERRFRYSPDHEKLTLNWARVVRPSGEIISEEPAQQQESDVAAALSNPVYANQKELRISLGGVAENTIIDVSYTLEEVRPYLAGDFFMQWNVHASTPAPVRRSRFILDVPASVQPRIAERNLNFAVVKSQAGGRRSYRWAAADVSRYRREAFSPDTNAIHMHVLVSLPLSWGDIARWYGSLLRDRYDLTPAVRARLAEITARAATRLDTIRAVHRWVAQDIRYVSVSLGLGGYQPRTPEQTVTTGFGDCKDKAILFVAALRALGIEAHPVLLNSNASAVRREHPSIKQFNHMIVAVRDGAAYTFTDLTAHLTPYGELPAPQQAGFALMVLADGQGVEITLPKMPPDARRIAYEIVATLSPAGELSGYMAESDLGFGFEARRNLFYAPLDSARKVNVMQTLLTILPGATGDSIHAFDGRDLYAPVRYKLFFSGARGAALTGGVALFTFPFGVLPATSRIRVIESMGERMMPIDAEQVLRAPPPTTTTVDMRVTLPAGWRVRVPQDVVVSSDFGSYSTHYSQEDAVLRIVRRESSAVGVYPPARLPDVIAFFRAISADENNKSIVIEPASN